MDSSREAERASEEIGACLEPTPGNPDLRRGYTLLKRWYRHESVRDPNPSRADIENFMGEYATLYRQEEPTPLGRPVPTDVTPFRVNEDVLSEAEAEVEVEVR